MTLTGALILLACLAIGIALLIWVGGTIGIIYFACNALNGIIAAWRLQE